MMTPLKITRSVQSLQRLQHIARVLTQHGFGHVVDVLELGRFVPLWLRRKSKRTSEEQLQPSLGRRLTRVAADLGPIYVKLGQMLATRPDVVPPEILTELQTLQDRVEPFNSSIATGIIEKELQLPVAEAFATIEDDPIASGSIGQVYKAELHGGLQVVIKVRRPNIERDIQSDIQLLKWLADTLERWTPELQTYRPTVMVEEFERALLRELDFMHEAATTARFREAFQKDNDIEIPEVIWSHTTQNVLTLQALDGENIDRAIERDDHSLERKRLAIRLADMYLKQFFEIGTFHADPHAGNILVKPPARVGLIDFGQIGILGDEVAGHLLILLLGAVGRDVTVMVDALVEMGAPKPTTDRNRLATDIQALLDKYYGQPIRRLRMGTIFAEIAETVRRHDLTIPRDVILMLKSLTSIWGITLRLDPELDVAALLKPRMMAMIRDRLSVRRAMRNTGVTLWHLLSFLRSAPQQLREVLRQVSLGQWQLNVRHDNLEPLGRELDRSSNRLAFSIIIAAVVVGSSLMVTADPDIKILGLVRLQSLGVAGYLIAGVLGIGLLWAIFRSGRLS